MDRQLPRLPRWSPNQAKRRLQASQALRFEAARWRWTRTAPADAGWLAPWRSAWPRS
jgi:hypothetical protein